MHLLVYYNKVYIIKRAPVATLIKQGADITMVMDLMEPIYWWKCTCCCAVSHLNKLPNMMSMYKRVVAVAPTSTLTCETAFWWLLPFSWEFYFTLSHTHLHSLKHSLLHTPVAQRQSPTGVCGSGQDSRRVPLLCFCPCQAPKPWHGVVRSQVCPCAPGPGGQSEPEPEPEPHMAVCPAGPCVIGPSLFLPSLLSL